MTAIAARGLGRDHGPHRALEALDLVVPEGALVGLLGPNGAGKTTTMLLLATLLAPTRGTAAVLGHDVRQARAAVRARLGLVFQEPSVDGLLTVGENLHFAGGLVGLAGAARAEAVRTALDRTGLASRAGQPARALSGGWRRLLDIARATLHHPRVLILDEPTVGLDPEHRAVMWHLLDLERRERGTTILFSTHYLQEAEAADAVCFLADGRKVAEGAPADLAAGVGDWVAEVDGPGAGALAERLDGTVHAVVARTPRGVLLGGRGTREVVAEAAARAPGVQRFVLRGPTLDDAYLRHTGAGDRPA